MFGAKILAVGNTSGSVKSAVVYQEGYLQKLHDRGAGEVHDIRVCNECISLLREFCALQ